MRRFTSISIHTSLIRLTCRNHTARRSKPGVYAKVVCRKCGERIREERRSHLDTDTTPVRPLFPQYVHSLVMCIYRDVSPISQIRAEVFLFFFFLRRAGSAVRHARIESTARSGPSSLTNNPGSPMARHELTRGLAEERQLCPPLLLQRQDR